MSETVQAIAPKFSVLSLVGYVQELRSRLQSAESTVKQYKLHLKSYTLLPVASKKYPPNISVVCHQIGRNRSRNRIA